MIAITIVSLTLLLSQTTQASLITDDKLIQSTLERSRDMYSRASSYYLDSDTTIAASINISGSIRQFATPSIRTITTSTKGASSSDMLLTFNTGQFMIGVTSPGNGFKMACCDGKYTLYNAIDRERRVGSSFREVVSPTAGALMVSLATLPYDVLNKDVIKLFRTMRVAIVPNGTDFKRCHIYESEVVSKNENDSPSYSGSRHLLLLNLHSLIADETTRNNIKVFMLKKELKHRISLIVDSESGALLRCRAVIEFSSGKATSENIIIDTWYRTTIIDKVVPPHIYDIEP